MTIDAPKKQDIPALKALWQEAFGDEEAFLDCFFSTAFSPKRCRCVTLSGPVGPGRPARIPRRRAPPNQKGD